MKNFDYGWQTYDKIDIYGKCWLPENDSQLKGMICLVHGFGEHILRYEHVAQFFTDHNYGFVAYDQRGHGQTKGKRGVVPSYKDVIDNVTEFLSLIKEKFPNTPLILYGHSMGGNIVTSYVLNYPDPPIKGAIITSPWLRLTKSPPNWQEKIGEFLGGLIKDFVMPSKLTPSDLSTDLSVGEAYVKDPLVHKKISSALYFGVKESGKRSLKTAQKLKVKTLLMHGTDDNITSYDASRSFTLKCAGELLTFKSWDGLRHELHNEKKKDEVLGEMLSFVDAL
ncbi:alpha/beta hydrolase [Flammeovirga sp. MY04]|uniref:alpha/beta hydrolase n=1 Tax=Flammeovirga sp. MY04 TaxID=1191459 RepID=UPI0008062ECF|nr:alpha/beta hydrolase [Flammeovirga sp. MY04]ANQ47731.1 alpha/beta hydrolase [Flammeovirga sp. MY04]